MKYKHMQEFKEGQKFQEFLDTSLPEFRDYHAHLSQLSFDQAPDYAFLKGLFRRRMSMEGWQHDWVFDWEDSSELAGGTLLPDEYRFKADYVERRGLDPC